MRSVFRRFIVVCFCWTISARDEELANATGISFPSLLSRNIPRIVDVNENKVLRFVDQFHLVIIQNEIIM